jgi:hypothetical protein
VLPPDEGNDEEEEGDAAEAAAARRRIRDGDECAPALDVDTLDAPALAVALAFMVGVDTRAVVGESAEAVRRAPRGRAIG